VFFIFDFSTDLTILIFFTKKKKKKTCRVGAHRLRADAAERAAANLRAELAALNADHADTVAARDAAQARRAEAQSQAEAAGRRADRAEADFVSGALGFAVLWSLRFEGSGVLGIRGFEGSGVDEKKVSRFADTESIFDTVAPQAEEKTRREHAEARLSTEKAESERLRGEWEERLEEA
jgi:hypothetical protein